MRALVLVVAAAGWLLVGPLAAAVPAHPLGLPAFASIEATGDRMVRITWSAAPDDVAVLARWLGEPAPAEGVLTRAQDRSLATSAALEQHLGETVQVHQDGRGCAADFTTTSVVESGVTAVFTCPEPVGEVLVRLALLTDVDRRYRTLASAGTADGPERLLFTADQPEQTVALRVGSAPERTGSGSGGGDSVGDGSVGVLGGSLPLEAAVLAVVDGPVGVGAVVLGLLLAFVVGAAHGLAPGHGKAIAAAYLVGGRGRPVHAVQVGVVVAAMHTASVLVLAVVVDRTLGRAVVDRAAGWIQVLAGGAVVVAGVVLAARWWRRRAAPGDHGHDHIHDHSQPAAAAPLSRVGIVALGATGGLLPSPTALLVVLSGLAVGRTGLALGLVALFSVGLATTVTLAGLAVLWGRDLLAGEGTAWATRVRTLLPPVGAGAVVVLGAAVVARGLAALLG